MATPTRHPRAANTRAQAAPIPVAAPVMSTTGALTGRVPRRSSTPGSCRSAWPSRAPCHRA
ncbi:MAG: hypothetical protein ACK55I_40840 [bacterium]